MRMLHTAAGRTREADNTYPWLGFRIGVFGNLDG
jgi:hypothetical protein